MGAVQKWRYTVAMRRRLIVALALATCLGCREGCDRRAAGTSTNTSTNTSTSTSTSTSTNTNTGGDEVDVASLPEVKGLPDPLLFTDGARVKTRADWTRRRAQIVELLERYQYGRMPPAPGNVEAKELASEVVFNGLAHKKLVALTMGPERQVGASVGLYLPTDASAGRLPVILHIDHRKVFGISAARQLVLRGYVVAGYDPTYLDPDRKGSVGSAQAAYPKSDWGTIAVWAWGAMRVADYLQTLPQVDPKKMVVAGHSRSGKTALWAGAMDRRFALVVPLGSGCGGAAVYREKSPRAESLAQVTGNFPHWFHPRLRAFANKEARLPFDQHFVLALVAPRALLSLDALGDAWANLPGTRRAYSAARKVYDLLGAADRQGIHFRNGKHEINDLDWMALADFADQVLRGKASGRDWTGP